MRFLAWALAPAIALVSCSTTRETTEISPAEAEIERLEQAVQAAPNDARAHYALGNSYFDAERYSEARDAFARSLELDSTSSDAFTNLGLTQRVLGDSEAAIANYRKALTISPDDITTLQNLVVALQAEGRAAEALDPLSRLVEMAPASVPLLNDYALTLEAAARFSDAAAVYNQVLKIQPDDLRVHYALGRCYFELGQWDQAIGAWRSVTTFDPDFGQAHSGLAAAYFERGDYDRAWASVRECQRLGAYTDPELVSRLQDASGKLGPE